jgi:hypothetical protein
MLFTKAVMKFGICFITYEDYIEIDKLFVEIIIRNAWVSIKIVKDFIAWKYYSNLLGIFIYLW